MKYSMDAYCWLVRVQPSLYLTWSELTFDRLVKCSGGGDVCNLVDFDSLFVGCVGAFQKRLGTCTASRCPPDGVSFCEKVLSKDAGNVAIDSSD